MLELAQEPEPARAEIAEPMQVDVFELAAFALLHLVAARLVVSELEQALHESLAEKQLGYRAFAAVDPARSGYFGAPLAAIKLGLSRQQVAGWAVRQNDWCGIVFPAALLADGLSQVEFPQVR